MEFDPVSIKIIDTYEFQRLRKIKQLGVCYRVFPGGCHNRFEHSLGVGHLAYTMAKQIGMNENNSILIRIAGLCHDLGHGPHSHAFDAFAKKNLKIESKHEKRSCDILEQITSKYNINLDDADLKTVCELIHPIKLNLPDYWYQIVANLYDEIDVDKMDYMRRDCHQVGMSHNIDIPRFLKNARVIENRICYPLKMTTYINHLFCTRLYLHLQVYQHPVVRSIEWMYYDYMNCIREILFESLSDLEKFIKLTDDVFDPSFLEWKYQKGELKRHNFVKAKQILDRIYRRKLYTYVKEVRITNETSVESIQKCIIEHIGKTAFEQDIILDLVEIGYEQNPIFKVVFFDKSGKTKKLSQKDSLALFPSQQKDKFLRVYTRNKERTENIQSVLYEA
jgi:HD superfamily phosphohydrolase